MQNRLFIHTVLILLEIGCFALGLMTTLISLIVFAVVIECLTWSKIFTIEASENASELQ